MFASRLLSILEAVPSDVKYETSVGDEAKQDVTMKENPNTILNDSENFQGKVDPLSVKSKEVHPLNGAKGQDNLSAFKVKGGDKRQNPKFVDEFSTDDEFGIGNTLGNEDRNGHLRALTDSLSSGTDTKDVHGSIEQKCSLPTEDITNGNRSGYGDSKLVHISAPALNEKEISLYTDKNVLEFESPELRVCYKEVNHVVKDIGIDEGTPVQEENLFESISDNRSGQLATPLLDDAKDVHPTGYGSREENSSELLGQENRDPPLQSSSTKGGVVKHFDLEDSTWKCRTNSGAIGKTATAASEEASFVDRRLPLEEFGTRSFLRSFLNSTNGEGDKATQPLDEQCSSGKAVPQCPAAAAGEAGQEDSRQLNKLHYDSKVESGSITFNFGTNGRGKDDRSQGTDEENASKEENSGLVTCHSQVIDSEVSMDKHRSSISDSVISQGKHDLGESSFSAASLAPYSGPIPFSGSLSLRSDGSVTSARSFAFPILQSEWNSSPVRMAQGDGRNFRKHKGWRSGLLCCRF